MKSLRLLLAIVVFGSQVNAPILAADFYWDADASLAGNNVDGTGLGGTGTWDTSLLNWWNLSGDVAWPNSTADNAIFSAPVGNTSPMQVTLSGALNANRVTFARSRYTLSGGSLNLGGTIPSVQVNMGESATINSQITGSGGLTLSGGGSLRLTNNTNSYTGATTLSNGSLIITNQAQLGTDTSTVVVGRQNPYPGSGATIGFGGGSLVLDGTGGAINFTRNLSLQARGPIGDRGAALLSVGNNTINGNISAAAPIPLSPPAAGAGLNTRINSVNGNLTIAGGLDVAGAAGSIFTILGGNNQSGMSNFTITGPVTGTGTIEKTGSGTLVWNPSATSGFSGRFRVSGGAASGQSSVRIGSSTVGGNSIFGTEAAPSAPMTLPLPAPIPAGAGSNSTIDMNGGILEVRADTNQTFANNVYMRTGSTFFADRAIGGQTVGGTVTFGNLHTVNNVTNTFNSRNGYGMTFGAVTLESAGNPNTFANGLSGLLTFDGNVWNNNDIATRTLSFSGNGATRINGNINATGVGKNLSKDGSGNLTIVGAGSSLTGAVTILGGGALTITDFGSINNANSEVINLSSATSAGTLIVGGAGLASSAPGLTTNKTINLASQTSAASIIANQVSGGGIGLNSNIVSTGIGAKALNLAGTSVANNVINGSISNSGVAFTPSAAVNTGATSLTLTANTGLAIGQFVAGTGIAPGTTITAVSGNTVTLSQPTNANRTATDALNVATGLGAINTLTKHGVGTWTLAGANSYTGTTTISQGTLRLQANGVASTVLPAANAVSFAQTNSYGGATLEFVGRSGEANTQSLGALTTTAGANTIRLAPVGGGSASLTFASAAAPAGSSVNVVGADATSRFTVTGMPTGLANRAFFFNGADFAYSDAGQWRAPQYGTDATFVTSATGLTAGANNELTGDVALPAGALSITTLKMNGPRTLTVDGASTLTTTAVLAVGGASTITGGSFASGFLARTDLAADTLTLASNITGTAGFTKVGEGTLVLAGTSNFSGVRTINEGTVRLGSAAALSGGNSDLIIRAGSLDLNGFNSTAIGAFTNNGTITNTAAGASTLTIGNGTGTGTSFGSINQTAGVINLTKVGTGTQNLWGLSNHTGVTRIGAGALAVDTLANIGTASGIGAGDTGNNAGSLVFETGGILDYRGAVLEGSSAFAVRSASTDRLFTINGTSATLSSAAANNNSVIWTNTGDIVFTGPTAARTLTLQGAGQGENTLVPRITDSAPGTPTSVTKNGTGIWRLAAANNTYNGATTINQGILMATDGQGLSSNSNLVFNGGTLYSQGAFNREIGTGAGQIQFAAPSATTALFSGGFSGGDSKLTVGWTTTPVWGSTAQFIADRDGLILNGSHSGSAAGGLGPISLSEVELSGNFSLGTATTAGATNLTFTSASGSSGITGLASTAGLIVGQEFTGTNIPVGSYIVSVNGATSITLSANAGASATSTNGAVIAGNLRAIRVDDNGNTGADYATLSGVISGGAGTGIRKLGGGQLLLSNNNNSYSGETNVFQGTLAVNSLGNSTVAGNSSVGTSAGANTNANAITLGNGTSGAGILQYLGAGETSDRKIRLNTTTANTQIHADGTGALILTNVANDQLGGAKVLFLRGSSAAGNTISSPLADNAGALGITIDGSANWILSGNNTYTGTTNAGAGALGIGSNTALGGSTLNLNNGNLYAYGADRTIGIAGNAPVVQHANNTSMGFQGDYSILVNSPLVNLSGANNTTTNNNIVAGKSLTFNGINANSIQTSNRNWAVDGSGTTIVNGDITTTTALGLSVTKAGDGVLQLNGTNSNFNQNNAGVDIDRGTLRAGATDVIPSFGAATPTTASAVTASAVIPVSATTGLKVGQLFTGTGVALGSRIVSIDSPTQITASLPSTIASGATLTFTVSGGVTLSPELDASDVATFDLNGFSQSINGLAATSTGTSIIDNSGAAPVTLTIGNNNGGVNFGNGTNNAITNSGGGALALTKVGSGAATLGGNNTYTGVTTITAGAVTAVNNNAFGSTIANTVINSNGTTTTGGALTLGVTTPGNGVTTSENFFIQGTGDGGAFVSAIAAGGGVTSNVNGVVTLNSTQSFRLGAGGANSVLNLGLIQRSTASGGQIVLSPGAGSFVNVNTVIDNNLGGITVHGGGTASLNASGNDIGDMLVQNSSTLQITASDALGLNRSLTLGQGAAVNGATGVGNDVATFQFNAASQTIGALNGFANAGTAPNNATATGSRLITSSFAGAKSLTVGNGNGSGGFNGVITDGTGGALSFTKVGTGTQSFLGTVANTYTGTTTVNGGTLLLGKTAGVNAVAGNLFIGDGAGGLDTVRLNSNDQIPDNSLITFVGSGANAGVLTLNGFNETVGGLSSLGGAGIIENASANNGTLTANIASGSQTFSGIIRNGTGAGTFSLTKTGAGTLELTGTNTHTGETFVNGGVLSINSNASLGAVATGATLNITDATLQATTTIGLWNSNPGLNNRNVVLNGTGGTFDVTGQFETLSIAGMISGTGGLTKTGAGVLDIRQASYAGPTNVNAGTLAFGAPINPLASAVNLGTSATLNMNGFSNTIGTLSGSGTVTNSGAVSTLSVGSISGSTTFSGRITNGANGLSLNKIGIDTLTLTGSTNDYTGTTTISGGTLALSGTGVVPATTQLTISGSTGTFDISGITGSSSTIASLSGVSGSSVVLGSKDLTINSGASLDSFTFAGIASGSGGMILEGPSTQIFTGANNYSGPTVVNGGTLLVNNTSGSGTGTGAVTVGNGAALGGTGTISGDVNFLSGAIYSPGNSPGVQTLAANATFNGDSVFNWELTGNTEAGRGTVFDGVNVTGGNLNIATGAISNLVFDGAGSTVAWADSFWDANRQWLVFDNTNTPTVTPVIFSSIGVGNDSLGQTLSPTRGSFAWTTGGTDILLSYTAVAVPEPGTLALLGLAGIATVVIRRRRANRRATV